MWERWHDGRKRCRMEKCMETLWCPKCLFFLISVFVSCVRASWCVVCAFVRSLVGVCVRARAREAVFLPVSWSCCRPRAARPDSSPPSGKSPALGLSPRIDSLGCLPPQACVDSHTNETPRRLPSAPFPTHCP